MSQVEKLMLARLSNQESNGDSGGGGSSDIESNDNTIIGVGPGGAKTASLESILNFGSSASIKGVMESDYEAGESLLESILNRFFGKIRMQKLLVKGIGIKLSLIRDNILTKRRRSNFFSQSGGGGH